MEAILQPLAGLLLKAVPTILFLLILHFYLKWMFFRPLSKVLAQRREATEGAHASAAALLEKASQQTAAIEAELRKAREAIYQEQEETRRRWIAEQTAQLDQARHQSREQIHQAKLELDAEVDAAKRQLTAAAGGLAGQIVQSLLERKSA